MTSENENRVRTLVSTVWAAINRPSTIQESEQQDSDDFSSTSVVAETFRNFRRRRQPNLRHAKRGRKATNTWKCKVFLLKRSNVEFLPSSAECKYLDENGYGSPETQSDTNFIHFNRNWTVERLKMFICELYPQMALGVVGYDFAKCDKGRKIRILSPTTVNALEKEVRRGRLLLVPKHDLTASGTESGTPTVTFHSQRDVPESSPRRGGRSTSSAAPSTQTSATESRPVMNAVEDGPSASVEAIPTSSASATDANNLRADPSATAQAIPTSPAGATNANNLHADPSATAQDLEDPIDDELPNFELDFDEDNAKMPTQHLDAKLTAEVKEMFVTLHTSLLDEREVTIRRSHIVEDVLKLYEEPEICFNRLNVTFEGEMGSDFGGLTKEMCTQFWKEVSEIFFKGEHITVPYLPLYRLRKEKSKFVTIGRALAHTAALTETLPCRLARSGIISMMFEDVHPELLLQDFLLYVSESEKCLISKAMSNLSSLSERELDRLQTFFCLNGLSEQPKESEFKDQILAIAEEVLVKQPSQLYALVKQGIPDSHKEIFWYQLSVDHLTHIMNAQRPTTEKVLEALQTSTEDLRPDEERVFYYLKEYIGSLDTDDLLDFLLFSTASIHTPQDKIVVSFNNISGIARRPVTHTCNNLLELSCNYFSPQEFKREMKAYLKDPDSYKYTII